MTNAKFELISNYKPAGDQPNAIKEIVSSLNNKEKFQTIKGVTGSGKTYTMANIIKQIKKPALVIAPNKTLAAQLYNEFKEFFPNNYVNYFVSYYDYYQPEAYIPSTDTYIEKDASINEEIDRLRHSATKSVLENRDTIVVASISCIYGLGSPEDYFNMMLFLEVGNNTEIEDVILKLVKLQYSRTDLDFKRGTFRVRGEAIDIFPADQDKQAIRVLFFGDEIEEISIIDSITGTTLKKLERITIYPLSHFITDIDKAKNALKTIKAELNDWLPRFRNQGKVLEAERLKQRVLYDLEMIKEIGFCSGIENYSRHFSDRKEGDSPTTLIDYFKDFVLFIDESHVTLPQLGGMYKGDRARKQNLVDFGFRLPSAKDNRPLKAEEFWHKIKQTVFVSATPGDFEIEKSSKVVELINRPTGLLDPEITIFPAVNQIDHVVSKMKEEIKKGGRVLVLTLTKKTSEDLSLYLQELNIKSRYLHSDIKTIERVEILRGLRKGEFDVLIGINLLREGLDLVEVTLVAILDADKEGFLRSTRSLIQIMGRAARNINGKVYLYADKATKSINEAVEETRRKRRIQFEYNKKNNIDPTSANSKIKEIISNEDSEPTNDITLFGKSILIPEARLEKQKLIEKSKREMFKYARDEEFEKAAELRDFISHLQKLFLTDE